MGEFVFIGLDEGFIKVCFVDLVFFCGEFNCFCLKVVGENFVLILMFCVNGVCVVELEDFGFFFF